MHSPIILSYPLILKGASKESNKIKNAKKNDGEKRIRSSSSSEKTNKVVSFSETYRVKATLHHDDYTDQEEAACWYSQEEYDEISRKCVALISKMILGKAQKYCVRGLERMIPKAADEHEMTRLDAYIAVFKEQKKHYFNNTEAIASKYRQVAVAAAKSQQVACEIGRQDALIAMRILKTQTP
jgi:hypothetical protein